MKKRVYSFLIFAMCCMMLFSSAAGIVSAANDDTSAQIKSLQNSLSSMELERQKINNALQSARSKTNTHLGLKRQYDAEIEVISSQIHTTELLIEQYNIDIEQSENEIKRLEEEEAKNQQLFDEMLRMSFKHGNDDYLTILFNSESFSDFLTRLDLIKYHLSYNQSVIDTLASTRAELAVTRENFQASKAELEKYKSEQITLQDELDTKSANAQSMIAALQADTAEYEKALKEVEESKKQLQNDIDELYRQLKGTTTTYYSGAAFHWPLPSNITRVSSGFVWRTNPITKKKELHNGLDFPASKGTNIYAAADGTVVKAQWYGGYGNCVIINHGGGIMTLYGHCNSLNVKNGQSVKAGDVIAFVGTTGMSTGYHLHFTVYENGTAVDPYKYLK